jgi:hypothetical protein
MPRLLSSALQSTTRKHDIIEVIPREEFVQQFGQDYKNQHVTALGPTGRGKSTLMYQLLSEVVTPDHQVISMHGKIRGRDPTVARAAKMLHLRIVEELPSATRQRLDRKRRFNGYIVAPLIHPMEATDEQRLLKNEFKRGIDQNYRTTSRETITHINEAHQTQEELKLRTTVEAPLMRGAPDNAVWNEAQRGKFLSYHTYNAPEHLFVFYDDDADNRKRYSDFGCADPDEIFWLTSKLKTKRVRDGRTISQCLYIRRGGGMYVVDT